MDFATKRFPEDAKLYFEAQAFANLTNVKKLYPAARRMKRRIIFHAGVTNSGKTHMALERLKQVTYGVYCAPLRLLAHEIYVRLNQGGLKCTLMTGQESKEIPMSTHSSCTIEMLNLHHVMEVAILDEIQMISDEQRGRVWTRALLGVCAAEVHLCGDASAIPIVQKLVEQVGEKLEIFEYNRHNELKITKSLQSSITKVQDRDCIVAFSRKDIYAIKNLIETTTNKKCCVIYGSLPPETRAEQADLFNDPNSGYTVMVASDAVGMGMNLNIRRIIFWKLSKFIFSVGVC